MGFFLRPWTPDMATVSSRPGVAVWGAEDIMMTYPMPLMFSIYSLPYRVPSSLLSSFLKAQTFINHANDLSDPGLSLIIISLVPHRT